jgi:hypothetical protein
MRERARGGLPDEDPGREFADRGVKLATTFGGAGVVHGDLTPECAELVGKVLDALGAKAGKEDDRTKDQRYHDALQEAMRPLCFCVMMDSWTTCRQTGRKPSSGPCVYARLSETYDAAESVPTQLGRSTGHARRNRANR